MLSRATLWRLLLALLVVVALNILLPPVFRELGFPMSADLWLILRAIIAIFAVIYVVTGRPVVKE